MCPYFSDFALNCLTRYKKTFKRALFDNKYLRISPSTYIMKFHVMGRGISAPCRHIVASDVKVKANRKEVREQEMTRGQTKMDKDRERRTGHFSTGVS